MSKTKNRLSRFRRLTEKLRRWWKREPDLPHDPFAYRMAPVRRGPKGRSGAAAVAEPDEDSDTLFHPMR